MFELLQPAFDMQRTMITELQAMVRIQGQAIAEMHQDIARQCVTIRAVQAERDGVKLELVPSSATP